MCFWHLIDHLIFEEYTLATNYLSYAPFYGRTSRWNICLLYKPAEVKDDTKVIEVYYTQQVIQLHLALFIWTITKSNKISRTYNCFSFNRISLTSAKSNFPHCISTPVVLPIHIHWHDVFVEYTLVQLCSILLFHYGNQTFACCSNNKVRGLYIKLCANMLCSTVLHIELFYGNYVMA